MVSNELKFFNVDREKHYLSAGALISQHGPVAEKCQNLTCLTNVMSEKIE